MSAPRLDLEPEHLRIVQDILRQHVPQYEVWAFGSRVSGKAKQYSDLDLAIISDQPLSLSVSAGLHNACAESSLPFKVDVVDWAMASVEFRGIIEQTRFPL
jgi:type I restriction enzyme, S subunit